MFCDSRAAWGGQYIYDICYIYADDAWPVVILPEHTDMSECGLWV